MTVVPPIHRDVRVAADPATAFAVFTGRIGQWWPLADLGVHHDGTVAFESGTIVERSRDGAVAVWGEVTEWSPPDALGFTWHPGRAADSASHVRVTFSADGEATLVVLTHSGWESFADPAAARAEYDQGWPDVLARFAGDRPGGGEDTWVVARHRPGPAMPSEGSIFAAPAFAEHTAFINRMRACGYLVAAGPLTDRPGEGMLILRLPGRDRTAYAERLVSLDDRSVASGFFAVTVRPWAVMVHG